MPASLVARRLHPQRPIELQGWREAEKAHYNRLAFQPVPELPEVETLRRSLARHLPGRSIVAIRVRERRLREPVRPARLKRLLTGRRVVALRRRAKYLLVDLEGGTSLLVHLGMSGRLSLSRPREPLDRHDHVRFTLDDGRELRFRDPRRFGLIDAIATAEERSDPRLARAGREPLDLALRPEWLWRRSRGVRRAVKTWIMDGGVLAGIGNIYANEALFRAAIRPTRRAGRVPLAQWSSLLRAIRAVLASAIRQGGTTLNDFADAEGAAGYFQVRLHVYDRGGLPCRRCRTAIRRTVLGQRSTFYCPLCQT